LDGHERADAVLRKLGATAEGRLREGFRSNGVVRDYVMWSILASEWQARQGVDTVRTI
jgi:RimJ/RimL family protein N-acetyltransferase